MSQDIEKLLGDVTPRGAPPELRDRLLRRVAKTLDAPTPTNRSRDCEGAVNTPIESQGATAGLSSSASHTAGQASSGTPRRWRFDTLLAWAVAGLVLLGVGLNFAAVRVGEARLAAFEPPRPEPLSHEQLIAALARADGGETDDLDQCLAAARWSCRRASGEEALRQYDEFLKKSLSLLKEPFHAACEEDTKVDVHRRRRPGRDTTDCQRHFGLDYRLTA